MTTESVDELFIDVIGRLDESSIRVLQRRLNEATEEAGEEAGGRLRAGMGAAMAALPALAATAAAAVGAALAAGTVAVVDLANEAQQNVLNFQSQLGSTKEEAQQLGEVAKEVFGESFSGSLEDAGQAVKNVRQEFKDLSLNEVAEITKNSVKIADAFEEDQAKVAQAVKVIMQSTGKSAEEATDYITAGFQKGLNKSGDFLDSVLEYTPQFEKAGASADDLFSILESGLNAGTLGTDKAADAFKEFTLRASDGAKSTVEAYEELGLNYDELQEKLKKGQITQADLFKLVVSKIQEVKNVADKSNLITALFGSGGEDLGAGFDKLDTTKTKLEDVQGATDKLNVKYQSFGAIFQSITRQLSLAFLPIGESILSLANEVMPKLKTAIDAVTPTIKAMSLNFGDSIKLFARGETIASGAFIKIGEVVRDVFSGIAPYVRSVVEGLGPIFQSVLPLIESVFNIIGALWNTVLRPVLDALAPAFKIAFTIAGAQIKGFVDLATGLFNALAALIKGDTKGALEILENTVKTVGTNMYNAFAKVSKDVIGILNSLGSELRKIGVNIVLGFIAGIQSKINKVQDVAQNFARIFLGRTKKEFDTRSPSRVMETLGKFVGQGFVNGVASEEPKVKRAAQGLAKNFLDSLKNLSIEREVGRIDLSTYIKALEGAQDKLRAKLSTVKESSPAYGEWLGALSKVTKELDKLTGKSSDAAKEAKKLADQIEQNKQRIADIEATEKYVKGLRSATDAQLKNALAVAKNTGDLDKYNKIRNEQKRRIDAVKAAEEKGKRAAEEYAAAQEKAFEAAEKTINQLNSFNLGGLDSRIAAPAAITNTQKTFDEMSLRIARLRDELKKPGTFEAWRDGLKQMRADGDLTEEQLQRLFKQLQDIRSPNFVGPVQARGGGVVDNGPLVQPDESGASKARGKVEELKEEIISTKRVSEEYGEEWEKLMQKLADTKIVGDLRERFAGVSDAQLEAAKSAAIAEKDVLAYTVITEEQAKRTKEASEAQSELANIKKAVAAAAQATKKPLSEQLERLNELKKESPELADEIDTVKGRILELQAAAAKQESLKKMQENLKQLSSQLGDLSGKINQVTGIFSKFGGEVAGAADIVGTYFTTNLKAAQQALQGDYAGAVLTTIEGIINIGDKLQELDPAYQQWKTNLNETGDLIRKNMGPRVVNGIINPFFDSLERDLNNRTELANANWMQRWWWANFGDAPEVLDDESAKLLAEISSIFNKIATATTGAIQDELINAFNTGDWEGAADEMSRNVQQAIAKIALDYIVQTSELAPKIAKFSEYFKKAIVGGLTDDEKAELKRLYDDIIDEQKQIAGRYRAIAEDLPGYERETQEKRYKEWKEWEEKRERDEKEAKEKRKREAEKEQEERLPRLTPSGPQSRGVSSQGRVYEAPSVDFSPIAQLSQILTVAGPQIERGGRMIQEGAEALARTARKLETEIDWSQYKTVK